MRAGAGLTECAWPSGFFLFLLLRARLWEWSSPAPFVMIVLPRLVHLAQILPLFPIVLSLLFRLVPTSVSVRLTALLLLVLAVFAGRVPLPRLLRHRFARRRLRLRLPLRLPLRGRRLAGAPPASPVRLR